MINFNETATVEAITQRLAVIFETADKQYTHEVENFTSSSELARMAWAKKTKDEINIRLQRELRTVARSASPLQWSQWIDSLNKSEISRRNLLKRAIEAIEPQ